MGRLSTKLKNRLTAKFVNRLTAIMNRLTTKLMNRLTAKLVDRMTAKVVVVNLVKLHLTKFNKVCNESNFAFLCGSVTRYSFSFFFSGPSSVQLFLLSYFSRILLEGE